MHDWYSGAEGMPTIIGSATHDILLAFATMDNDGTTMNANGNYTGGGLGTKNFVCQPPPGEIWQVSRLITYIEDGSAFRTEFYGGISGGLTNGILIRKSDDGGIIIDLTDSLGVKTNGQWARLNFDVNIFNFGAGNEALAARWTFSRAGANIRLIGDDNERLEANVSDDLTGLINHNFSFQGFKENV